MKPARAHLFIHVALVASLLACKGGGGMKPRSGGEPYEVLVVTADRGLRVLADSLLRIDVEGLPQCEAAYKLSHADRLNGATEYARCMVVLRTDAAAHGRTSLRYERNATAKPQLVISVTTPSAGQLKEDFGAVRRQLAGLIDRFELSAEAERLRDHHSPRVSEALGKQTGWTLLAPTELSAMKRGKDFVWLSSDAPEGVRCLCLYSFPGDSLDARRLVDMRDSVLGANIPGERPPMRMATERRVPPRHRLLREQGRMVFVTRGLWQMEGDAMGGPFVSRAVVDSLAGRVVVAEAFVYAPERRKASMLRRLEAALLTMEKVKR